MVGQVLPANYEPWAVAQTLQSHEIVGCGFVAHQIDLFQHSLGAAAAYSTGPLRQGTSYRSQMALVVVRALAGQAWHIWFTNTIVAHFFYIRLCEDEHLQNNGTIYRCVCVAHLLLVESRFLFCLNPGLSCYTQQNDFVQFKAGSKRILLYSWRTSLQMLAIVGFRNGAVLPYGDPSNIQNIEPQNPSKQKKPPNHIQFPWNPIKFI